MGRSRLAMRPHPQLTAAGGALRSYYSTLAAAHADGLVTYFPLSATEGATQAASVTNVGSANNGTAYSHNGMVWKQLRPEVHRRYGYALLDNASSAYIRPTDPQAASQVHTILVIVPASTIYPEAIGTMLRWDKYKTIDTGGLIFGTASFDASTKLVTALTFVNGAGTQAIATGPANRDGVAYCFFSYDGSSVYKAQVNDGAEVSSTGGDPSGTDSSAWVFGASWSGGSLQPLSSFYGFEIAHWSRVLTQAEKNEIARRRTLLVAGYVP